MGRDVDEFVLGFMEKMQGADDKLSVLLELGGASGGDVAGHDFSGVMFRDDDLSGYDFAEANLEGASFESVNLSGVRFSRARLKGAAFSDVNLTRASFDGADIRGGCFSRSFISDVCLRGAAIDGARFLDSQLSDCDISGVSMQNASFSTCILDKEFYENVVEAGGVLSRSCVVEARDGQMNSAGLSEKYLKIILDAQEKIDTINAMRSRGEKTNEFRVILKEMERINDSDRMVMMLYSGLSCMEKEGLVNEVSRAREVARFWSDISIGNSCIISPCQVAIHSVETHLSVLKVLAVANDLNFFLSAPGRAGKQAIGAARRSTLEAVELYDENGNVHVGLAQYGALSFLAWVAKHLGTGLASRMSAIVRVFS